MLYTFPWLELCALQYPCYLLSDLMEYDATLVQFPIKLDPPASGLRKIVALLYVGCDVNIARE